MITLDKAKAYKMVLDTKPGQATAHETRRPEHSQVMAEGPEPTNPPAALEQLALHPRQKELDGSTCGFIEGRTGTHRSSTHGSRLLDQRIDNCLCRRLPFPLQSR